ncbi:MAG: signal peptidase II [Microbacteriaceae bacterium]
MRALAVLAFVAVAIYVFDQWSKFLVVENLTEGNSVPVIGEILQFTFVRNPGAAFSIFSGTTWIFAIIATAVAIFIVIFARRIRATSWAILFGLLLGGNVGNLTDRLIREPGFGVGHVIDFIHVFGFPAIFNIADIAIVSSMGLFIILTLRGVGLDGSRTTHAKSVVVARGVDSETDVDAHDMPSSSDETRS